MSALPSHPPSRYVGLARGDLARLVPELLLCGHLIDRAGMAWCIEAWGREEMTRIAIEEWMGASPVYTQRMQRAMVFEGDDVVTIFKGLQLDIGAPPQFMDFRYAVHDRWHGEFWLDHCGALMDVEPMGQEYVVSMCHDIEDPTFDATAVATNPRARMRPIHRPPRSPADRRPHCAWTVTIDPSHSEIAPSAATEAVARTRAATTDLQAVDPSDDGVPDYAGPLLADLDFATFSHAALVRLADEVALQMHLLSISFVLALGRRCGPDQVRAIATRQLIGSAGLTASRLHRALGLGRDVSGAARLLALHPALNPAAYVALESTGDGVVVHRSPAHEDSGWLPLCGPHEIRPLQAVVRSVAPHLDVEVTGSATDWTARVVERDAPVPEFEEVAVARLSTGAGFELTPRRSLPLTPL
ncbi:hypothetical protein [Nocardioides terrisoli]|uniref:hypothetical protein n=1 Tax=Nocardioides terrisoli TaxID=3388267 RepID=UPI00287B8416|nr:hypothetical protein [Nocardioides marmorisolisilvae]